MINKGFEEYPSSYLDLVSYILLIGTIVWFIFS